LSAVLVKVRAKTMGNIVVESIFQKNEVYRMLAEKFPEMQNLQRICVSDVFLAGFVYKPLSFDCVKIRSDEEYRALKRIKSAKYIECTLLKHIKSGEDLVRAFLYRRAELEGEYICDCMQGKKKVFRNMIVPERMNPIAIYIPKEQELEFYVEFSNVPAQFLQSGELCRIGGFSLEITNLEKTERIWRDEERMVLQTMLEIEKDATILPGDRSRFRVGYDTDAQVQYYKAGSVFDESIFDITETMEVKPFLLPLEENE